MMSMFPNITTIAIIETMSSTKKQLQSGPLLIPKQILVLWAYKRIIHNSTHFGNIIPEIFLLEVLIGLIVALVHSYL